MSALGLRAEHFVEPSFVIVMLEAASHERVSPVKLDELQLCEEPLEAALGADDYRGLDPLG